MGIPRIRLRLLTCLLFAIAPLGAQSAAPVPVAEANAPPLCVRIVGASVSAGFRDGPLAGAAKQGDSIDLQKLLRNWAGDEAEITAHNPQRMMMMFMSPMVIGRQQVDAAAKAEPGLVVAVDFPFWFAYGTIGPGDELALRSERLASGLAMLLELDVPTVIGDLPDMTGAAARMLRPAQIPSPAVLAKLNVQIAAFAKEHAKIHVVPLAGIVDAMRVKGVALPLAGGSLQTAPGALQQEDKLHATRLGMAFLGCRLQPVLVEALPAGHPLRARTWTFEQWVAAAGAEDELDALRTAAKAKAEAKDAGEAKSGAGR